MGAEDQEEQIRTVQEALSQVHAIRGRVSGLFDQLAAAGPSGTKELIQDVHSRAASLQAQWGPLSAAVAQAKDPKAAAAEVKVKEEKPGALSSTAGTGAGAGQAASQWGAAVRAELEAALCHELMLPMHWCMEIRRREQSGLPGSTVGPLSPAADSATPGTGQQGGPQAPSSAPSAAGAGGAGAASAAGGPRELQEVIERVRAACPGMVIHGCSLQGTVGVAAKDAAEVRLAYPRVFCASIALAAPGRPEPLRVILQSTDRAAEADPWAGTTHHLFRRISSLAMRALAYYQRRAAYHCLTATAGAGAGAAAAAVNGAGPGAPPKAPTPGQGPQAGGAAGGAGPAGAGHGAGVAGASAGAVALEEVLLWLASYRDLFARPCLATGKLMAMEPSSQNPLPPLFRPFMLSRQELLQCATDASCIRAYHMHAAPADELGWDHEELPPPAVMEQLCPIV